MTRLSDYDTSGRCEATVKETHRITPENAPEIRNIQLTVSNPRFRYREGQNIGVMVPGPKELGREAHFRLYTIANAPSDNSDGGMNLELCVRRCFYIDEVNGEEYPGIASNYLCDARPGDSITISGPYGDAFTIPDDNEANILMIGTGTGIAPFRAFIQHMYDKRPDWKGKVRLFYGARTGMENLYQNDQRNDFTNYYDEKTFQAFEGLSVRPWALGEDTGLGKLLEDNAQAIWELIQEPKTHVYVAGLPKTLDELYKVMENAAGSKARFRWTREEMLEQKRWAELIYG